MHPSKVRILVLLFLQVSYLPSFLLAESAQFMPLLKQTEGFILGFILPSRLLDPKLGFSMAGTRDPLSFWGKVVFGQILLANESPFLAMIPDSIAKRYSFLAYLKAARSFLELKIYRPPEWVVRLPISEFNLWQYEKLMRSINFIEVAVQLDGCNPNYYFLQGSISIVRYFLFGYSDISGAELTNRQWKDSAKIIQGLLSKALEIDKNYHLARLIRASFYAETGQGKLAAEDIGFLSEFGPTAWKISIIPSIAHTIVERK